MSHPLAAALFASSACLLAAWLGVALARKRSAAWRHLIWRYGLAFAVLAVPLTGAKLDLPLLPARPAVLAPPLPAQSAPTLKAPADPKASSPIAPTLSPPSTRNESASATPFRLDLSTLWLVGSLVALLSLASGWSRLARLRREAHPVGSSDPLWTAVDRARAAHGFARPVEVLISDTSLIPLACGIFRPCLVYPRAARQWSSARLAHVASHEIAHHVRRDLAWSLFARLACALLWMNPLLWWASSRLRLEGEMACDDLVLARGACETAYAEDLLAIVRECSELRLAGAAAMARPAQILVRLTALLDRRRERRPPGLLGTLSVAAVFLAILGLLSVRLIAAQTTPSPNPPSAISPFIPHAEARLRVVDEAGLPIRGATLQLRGIRTQSDMGSYYGYDPKRFGPATDATTDQDGFATVSYPLEVLDGFKSSTLCLFLHHPAYATENTERTLDDFASPITLHTPARLEIIAHLPEGEKAQGHYAVQFDSERHTPDWGHPWKITNNQLVNDLVHPGSTQFRAVFVADDGRIFFSAVTAENFRAGEEKTLNLALQPGVVIKGSLEDSVPRPIKDGSVSAFICPGLSVSQVLSMGFHPWPLLWEVTAKIMEDGSFAFPPMPQDDHVYIIALCDGFVSRQPDPPERMKFGGTRYGQPFAQNAKIVVGMEKTGDAKITVLAPDGKPLPGASVSFWPNQSVGVGTTILGGMIDSLSQMGITPRDLQDDVWPGVKRWTTLTGPDGVATIPNLPSGWNTYAVLHPLYQMPKSRSGLGVRRRDSQINIPPADLASAEITMDTLAQKIPPLSKDKDVSIKTWLVEIPGESDLATSREFNAALAKGDLPAVRKLMAAQKLTDPLALPPLVTKTQRKATTQAAQEYPYASEFVINEDGSSQPSAFETEHVGLTLECRPTIYSEGINLQLHLISREFSDYGPGDTSHNFPNFKTEEVRLLKDVPNGASLGFWLPWTHIPLPDNKVPSPQKKRVGVIMTVNLEDPQQLNSTLPSAKSSSSASRASSPTPTPRRQE